MIVKAVRFLIFVCTALLSACASNLETMQLREDEEVETPALNESVMVFMRASAGREAAKITAAIYDVTSGEPRLVGLLPDETKLSYKVSPGNHMFMVYCDEAADFMQVYASGGKSYYTVVNPRPGTVTWRFNFRPIRNGSGGEYSFGSSEFKKWNGKTKLIENTAASESWNLENRNSVMRNMRQYRPLWDAKSQAQRDNLTLLPTDFAPQ
jgi:hypothetical protein